MNISFKDLRDIKHKLPTGSVTKIASELNLEAQTVRNFFGAKKYEDGQAAAWHLQPGPDGGIMVINDTTILDVANRIIREEEGIHLSSHRLGVN